MSPRISRVLCLLATAALAACDDSAPDSSATKSAAPAKSPDPGASSVEQKEDSSPGTLAKEIASARRRDSFDAAGYNLVFISLTNTRADHLGAYGYDRDTSANIDRLAKSGVVFENVFTHASWTLPAVMSLFTSRYPFTHGLMNRKSYEPLPEETPTFLDVLKKNGYLTGAFVGDRDYSGEFGHTNRFHELRDDINPQALKDWKAYGVLRNGIPHALRWLRENHSKKFFLLLQGYDTHCPFAIPTANARFNPDYESDVDFSRCYWTFRRTEPIRTKDRSGKPVDAYILKSKSDDFDTLFLPADVEHMVALYDGEIHAADALIGTVLDEIGRLGIAQKTIVVFFSDHGDMFGKHGRFMRGGPLRGTFYDDVLHVPLIVRHPGLSPRRVAQLAQVIDIAPTLLDFLGLSSPASFRGKSLRPAIIEDRIVNEHVFAGSAYTPKSRNRFFQHDSIIASVRSRRWKLIREKLFFQNGSENHYELFDLDNDPEELENLAKTDPERVRELDQKIAAWLEAIGAVRIQEALSK